MDKILRNVLIVGILVASFSSLWAFVYLPYKREKVFNACLAEAESTLAKKQTEIRSHVEDLERQKATAQEEADKKLQEFLKANPEPENPKTKSNTTLKSYLRSSATWDDLVSSSTPLNLEEAQKRIAWQNEKEHIFDAVHNLSNQVQIISSDFKKIEKENKEGVDECYRRFK